MARALAAAGDKAAIFGPGWPRPGAPLTGLARARGSCVVNLHPHFGALYPRVLLEMRASPAVLGRAQPGPGCSQAAGAAAGGGLEAHHPGPGDPAVVLAEPSPGPGHPLGRCLAWLLTHPDATLGGAWRKGLIWTLAAEDQAVSKNQARSAIAATPLGARHGRFHLAELPLDALATLPEQVAKTLDLARPESIGSVRRRRLATPSDRSRPYV